MICGNLAKFVALTASYDCLSIARSRPLTSSVTSVFSSLSRPSQTFCTRAPNLIRIASDPDPTCRTPPSTQAQLDSAPASTTHSTPAKESTIFSPLQGKAQFPKSESPSATSTSSSKMGSLQDVRDVPATPAPVKILIVGLSYAGLSAAVNLIDLAEGLQPRMASTPYEHHPQAPKTPVEITFVDERDGFYHLIGTPLAFVSSSYAPKSWVKFQDIPALQVPNVKFIQGSLTKVDPESKTATVTVGVTKAASEISYDYFVAASGLRRVFPVVPQSLSKKAFMLEAEEQIHASTNAPYGVVVVGGGAVGIEMAAELKVEHPQVQVTLVHSRDKLLSAEDLTEECKDVTLKLIKEIGVEVLLNHRVAGSTAVPTTDGSKKLEVEFTDGSKMFASEVIMAISKPESTATYLPSEALDENGFVKIHPHLAFSSSIPNAHQHFASGDVALWTGIKRCGGAMHMGHYTGLNVHQTILKDLIAGYEPKFSELTEFPPVIGLSVGKKAVASSAAGGTISGEDVMQSYFQDDLGFKICWNNMQLGGRK